MDFLTPHLEFFAAHVFAVVFFASLIEAAGIPFPSRIILILAPAFLTTDSDLPRLAVVAAIGFVLGDHIPYLAGRLAGMRVLELYCKVTLGSAQCVDTALGYFRRFGAPALLIGRFSTSVRLFAAAWAGCGHISYRALSHLRRPRRALLHVRVGPGRLRHRRARRRVLHQ